MSIAEATFSFAADFVRVIGLFDQDPDPDYDYDYDYDYEHDYEHEHEENRRLGLWAKPALVQLQSEYAYRVVRGHFGHAFFGFSEQFSGPA